VRGELLIQQLLPVEPYRAHGLASGNPESWLVVFIVLSSDYARLLRADSPAQEDIRYFAEKGADLIAESKKIGNQWAIAMVWRTSTPVLVKGPQAFLL
jgi:hypothetical protein